MRIQETDKILKESRHARHSNAMHHDEGFMARTLKAITSLPSKVMSLFKH